MKWRLIQSGHQDGYNNMAIDEAIFTLMAKGAIPPTLRLYGWSPPAISIGYFQSPLIPPLIKGVGEIKERSKLLKLRNDNIDVVRRLTGGGAILHDRELTYCIVASLKTSIIPEDVSASYNFISGAIINGLQSLGISARLRGAVPAPEKTPVSGEKTLSKKQEPFFCFERTSKYDIIYRGKKLSGSAQRRKNSILLHHGSISLTGPGRNSRASINTIPGRKTAFKNLSRNIIKGFEGKLSADLVPGELTKAEQIMFRRLRADKYNKRTNLK